MDILEMYITLRREGLSDEEATEIVGDPFTCTDRVSATKLSVWEIALLLAIVAGSLLCTVLTIGGL